MSGQSSGLAGDKTPGTRRAVSIVNNSVRATGVAMFVVACCMDCIEVGQPMKGIVALAMLGIAVLMMPQMASDAVEGDPVGVACVCSVLAYMLLCALILVRALDQRVDSRRVLCRGLFVAYVLMLVWVGLAGVLGEGRPSIVSIGRVYVGFYVWLTAMILLAVAELVASEVGFQAGIQLQTEDMRDGKILPAAIQPADTGNVR